MLYIYKYLAEQILLNSLRKMLQLEARVLLSPIFVILGEGEIPGDRKKGKHANQLLKNRLSKKNLISGKIRAELEIAFSSILLRDCEIAEKNIF